MLCWQLSWSILRFFEARVMSYKAVFDLTDTIKVQN